MRVDDNVDVYPCEQCYNAEFQGWITIIITWKSLISFTYVSPSNQCIPIVFTKFPNWHMCTYSWQKYWRCVQHNTMVSIVLLDFHRSVTHSMYDYGVPIHPENHALCIDTMTVCKPITNDSLISLWLGNKPHVSHSNPITILIGH